MIEEFGGWQLFQELLQTLCGIADRHTSLTATGGGGDSRVSVAMVAIQYNLSQKQVGGVIIGSHDDL